MITLIITIVVMVIIAGTTVYTSLDRFETNKLKKLRTDLELLSNKVANYYLKYNGLPLLRDSDNNAIQYTYTTLDFDKNENDNGNYYIIDLAAMEGISLNYGKEGFENPNTSDDVYIINEKSHTIYYVRGIELDGIIYHYIEEDGKIADTIPPTTPQIKVVSGDLNSEGMYMSDVEIEIIPGRDNWSGENKTTYSINEGTEIDITTLNNNILKITENGIYTIRVKTYDNNNQSSKEKIISLAIKKIPPKAYIVALKSGMYFKENSYINNIKTINFVRGIDSTAVSNAIKTYELGNTTYGTEKNEVMGWIDSDYNLYIGSESTIYSKNLQYAFYNMNAVTNITFNNLNTSECISMYSMFNGCSKLTTLDVSSFNTSEVTNMQGMFYNCSELTALDISSFNTSKVTTMQSMFYNCKKLITLDLRNFDTSKVTSMYYMFNECNGLTTLDISSFNTSEVTTMHGMFANCSGLTTLDISSFNTSKVTTMQAMFYNCKKLIKLNVSNFNTSQVTNMNNMFAYCSGLTTLDLSSFNTSQVTNMNNMFINCRELTTLDLSSFNTSQVTSMNNMFYNCTKLTTLDVSSFNTNQVTNMNNMFAYCTKLTRLNMNQATFENVTTYSNMFASVPTNIIIVSNSTGQTFLRARLDETIGSGNGTINAV